LRKWRGGVHEAFAYQAEKAGLVTHRVVQWATGAMGRSVLRTVIGHPGTDLVGVYAVAALVINAIPYVVAAQPGLLTRPVSTPARDDYLTYSPAG